MSNEARSDDQVRAYSAFEELPSLSDLEKFLFLDAFDRDVIAKSRQDSHRLGLAVQIGTVRYKGLFLTDPLAVPWPVVDYLAEPPLAGLDGVLRSWPQWPVLTRPRRRRVPFDAFGPHPRGSADGDGQACR
ncbi:DUF4158 domain-containing protein [Nonomuraea sp. NPDC050786]|uniref:DUF4158 domain-containing protein n=1 Tax=Nonomuraea sp. NPDC050786 TaxID=3154840 RepID=UPI0033CC63CB